MHTRPHQKWSFRCCLIVQWSSSSIFLTLIAICRGSYLLFLQWNRALICIAKSHCIITFRSYTVVDNRLRLFVFINSFFVSISFSSFFPHASFFFCCVRTFVKDLIFNSYHLMCIVAIIRVSNNIIHYHWR